MSTAWRASKTNRKSHREFHKIDLDAGWETPAGYPEGFKQKILASDLDENNQTGSRTRLLKLAPGTFSTVPFIHDHWEEVYLLEGEMIVGNDEYGHGGERFKAPTYACRPAGVYHGPFKSETGCMMVELHYYTDE